MYQFLCQKHIISKDLGPIILTYNIPIICYFVSKNTQEIDKIPYRAHQTKIEFTSQDPLGFSCYLVIIEFAGNGVK